MSYCSKFNKRLTEPKVVVYFLGGAVTLEGRMTDQLGR